MVGNDVVDLRDPDSRPESFRPRFDERVFSRSERRAIACDPRDLVGRWVHWAAKESAYKLARRLDSGFVFRPRALRVELGEAVPAPDGCLERRGWVTLGSDGSLRGARLAIRSRESDELVHVIATTASDWRAVVGELARLESPTRDDPSAVVRRLLRRGLATRLGVCEDRIGVGRRGRMPTVLLDDEEIDLAVSLSHHGRFVAWAAAPGSALSTTDSWTALSSSQASRSGNGAGPWPMN